MTNDQRPTTNDQRPTIGELVRRWSLVVRRWLAGFDHYRLITQLIILVGLAVALPALGRAQEQQPNRAGVVIRHGNGQVTTACVSFTEPEISGLTLLDRAGVSYLAQSGGIGAAVCKLDGEGCEYPTEDCFCHCKGAECVYWIYHHLRDGKWSYSQAGAGASVIRPGDVDGWVWGAGNLQTGAQPPAISFGEVCPAPSDDQQTAATEVAPASPPPTEAPPAPTPPPTPRPTRTPRTPATAAAISPSPAAPEIPAPTLASTAETPAPTTVVPATAQAPATTEATSAHPASAQAPTVTAAAYPAYIPPATAAPLPTQAPRATTGPPGATPPSRAGSGYLGFGILALILIGGIVVVLLRRRGRSR